jgi:IMP dehydrogenase
MQTKDFEQGFTFDDLLLVPDQSSVLPGQVDVRSRLSRNISLNVPIVVLPWIR